MSTVVIAAALVLVATVTIVANVAVATAVNYENADLIGVRVFV